MVHLAFTHVDCLREEGDIALIIDLFKEWLCLECFCSEFAYYLTVIIVTVFITTINCSIIIIYTQTWFKQITYNVFIAKTIIFFYIF